MTDHRFDVVVIGGGIAGLSAAVAAAERGASVVLLERSTEAETGGNTRYTEAFLRMQSIDTPAEGIKDSLLGDFMGYPDPGIMMETVADIDRQSALLQSHHVVNVDYVETFVASAAPTLRWLTGHGVSFGQLPTPFLTTSTPRMAPVGGGQALVETLGEAARALGVEFRFRTTARTLRVDDLGAVTGIDTATEEGSTAFTGQVVLACGGFQGSAEMMARYHGERALTTRPVARGGNYNKGEGIEMAITAGAATAGNFALFHAEPVDPRSGQPEAALFCFPYGILVNRQGRRFVDEARGPVDAWYERTTREIQAQPEGVAYVILDADTMEIPNIETSIRTDQPAVDSDTIDGLADRIGVPRDALTATVAAYNASCVDGDFDHLVADGLATVGLHPAKSNWARALARPPFVAYPIMAANVFTFGGLKTNAAAQILSTDGLVIPGLWAAGEITGLYYTNYTGSTSVLRGAVFGRLAGTGAAAAAAVGSAPVPSRV